MPSVLQDWVTALPRRHQAALITACRGCDGVPKRDPSKVIVCALRAAYLIPADPSAVDRPGSFLYVSSTLVTSMQAFASSHDEYPVHFFLHLLHAAQIVGYKHPDEIVRTDWRAFYEALVHKMHLAPEGEDDMDARLTIVPTVDGGDEPVPRRPPLGWRSTEHAAAIRALATDHVLARNPLHAWQALTPGYRAECIQTMRESAPPREGILYGLRLLEILGSPSP